MARVRLPARARVQLRVLRAWVSPARHPPRRGKPSARPAPRGRGRPAFTTPPAPTPAPTPPTARRDPTPPTPTSPRPRLAPGPRPRPTARPRADAPLPDLPSPAPSPAHSPAHTPAWVLSPGAPPTHPPTAARSRSRLLSGSKSQVPCDTSDQGAGHQRSRPSPPAKAVLRDTGPHTPVILRGGAGVSVRPALLPPCCTNGETEVRMGAAPLVAPCKLQIRELNKAGWLCRP